MQIFFFVLLVVSISISSFMRTASSLVFHLALIMHRPVRAWTTRYWTELFSFVFGRTESIYMYSFLLLFFRFIGCWSFPCLS